MGRGATPCGHSQTALLAITCPQQNKTKKERESTHALQTTQPTTGMAPGILCGQVEEDKSNEKNLTIVESLALTTNANANVSADQRHCSD